MCVFYAEKMWQALGRSPIKVAGCDQTRLSNYLIESNITWTPFDYDTNHYIRGATPTEHLTVIALPQEVVCRNECNSTRLSSFYVWHPWSTHRGGGKHKIMAAQKVWRTSDKWNTTLKTSQSPMDWLNELTV